MRLRRATLAIAALSLLGVAACGDDSEDKATPPAFVDASTGAGVSAAPGAPGAPGGASAGPGGTATLPSSAPGEGTSTAKPPKKGGGAKQGPAGGRQAGTPEVLSAAGVGPYAIGIKQTELKSSGLVGKVSTKEACATAKGLSDYDSPALAFSGGKLQRLTVTSTKLATGTGAKVGTSYADVKGQYPGGKQLNDWNGATAWYAVDGANALLFRIKDDKVASIDAGTGQAVQFKYTDQQGC
jgi:hypothetical protein